jgi:hypothetical protein
MVKGMQLQWAVILALLLTSISSSPVSAKDTESYGLGTSKNNFVGTNQIKRVVSAAERAGGEAKPPPVAEPLVTSADDGLDYISERACTAGTGEALSPATCPTMNAQCDAQDDGVLVNWIEVNSNVQPASQTPTGRSSCMYPGLPPEPPLEGADPAVAEAPVVITVEEFQKQPVLAAAIVSQPLNFGLRNAHSNIYAEAVEQDFTFEFQDAMIVLKARPVSYQWSYGDSTSATTSTPGGPVDGVAFNTQTSTSHQYVRTGDFTLTLTTFFAGDYSVDGGPFQPVAGEASVMSEPHLMSIWRTKGHNVSENCIENPTGIGCEAPTR